MMRPHWQDFAERKGLKRAPAPERTKAKLVIEDVGPRDEPQARTTIGRVTCTHGQTERPIPATVDSEPLWVPIERLLTRHDLRFRCGCTAKLRESVRHWRIQTAVDEEAAA